MSFSEFTVQDYELIAREYATLREAAVKRCADESELSVIQKAFEFANEAHKNVRRRSGEPYILHPIAVAKIVINTIGLGYKSIAAALLHDVVEDTDVTVDDIRNLFGDKIATLVYGLTKIKTVLDNEEKKNKYDEYSNSEQAENLKRILLTMNDDVRVVLIKLADRLHNCRTIEFMPEHKRDKILSETMFIFIPLAHRLGLYEVKTEMENIWLRYKEPEAFNEISMCINKDMSDKEASINSIIGPIETALNNAGFDFSIKRRVKSPYSIWHKMKTKNLTFEQVYDLYAVRIIFNPNKKINESERDQCYHIFSIVTGIYKYKADRVRDWVKQPKSNGYEALHCTIMSNSGTWIEVQIRSKRMDDIAEKGIAAHWSYKKDGYISENDSQMESWLSKVKEILVSPDVNTIELLDIIHNNLVTTDIMVFTPKGEQKSIAKGATALDFAYLIHTEIGNKAIAAKINMKLFPLSHQLKTGDQIEIITAENSHPQKNWLQFVKTRHAISKVLEYYRSHSEDIIKEGEAILINQLSNEGIEYNEHIGKKVCTYLDINNVDELCFRLCIGQITMDDVLSVLGSNNKPVKKTIKDKRSCYIINSPTDSYHYHIASCCNPISGDPVIGFLSPDGTISVHKKTCHVAESIASKHGDWIVRPIWDSNVDQDFSVKINLKGIDRKGLINEISSYISLVMGVAITKIYLGAKDGIFDGYLELKVKEKKILSEIISNLKKINGIQNVMRTEL